ncbi:hypothetical protein AURDEDRAFT_126049 [Auricularia subglabra TFB-10046 SS5]|nr:hypothetical protein AURDEDRAFT_126049 [Auricularia subglabra TFB-10046 SS5]
MSTIAQPQHPISAVLRRLSVAAPVAASSFICLDPKIDDKLWATVLEECTTAAHILGVDHFMTHALDAKPYTSARDAAPSQHLHHLHLLCHKIKLEHNCWPQFIVAVVPDLEARHVVQYFGIVKGRSILRLACCTCLTSPLYGLAVQCIRSDRLLQNESNRRVHELADALSRLNMKLGGFNSLPRGVIAGSPSRLIRSVMLERLLECVGEPVNRVLFIHGPVPPYELEYTVKYGLFTTRTGTPPALAIVVPWTDDDDASTAEDYNKFQVHSQTFAVPVNEFGSGWDIDALRQYVASFTYDFAFDNAPTVYPAPLNYANAIADTIQMHFAKGAPASPRRAVQDDSGHEHVRALPSTRLYDTRAILSNRQPNDALDPVVRWSRGVRNLRAESGPSHGSPALEPLILCDRLFLSIESNPQLSTHERALVSVLHYVCLCRLAYEIIHAGSAFLSPYPARLIPRQSARPPVFPVMESRLVAQHLIVEHNYLCDRIQLFLADSRHDSQLLVYVVDFIRRVLQLLKSINQVFMFFFYHTSLFTGEQRAVLHQSCHAMLLRLNERALALYTTTSPSSHSSQTPPPPSSPPSPSPLTPAPSPFADGHEEEDPTTASPGQAMFGIVDTFSRSVLGVYLGSEHTGHAAHARLSHDLAPCSYWPLYPIVPADLYPPVSVALLLVVSSFSQLLSQRLKIPPDSVIGFYSSVRTLTPCREMVEAIDDYACEQRDPAVAELSAVQTVPTGGRPRKEIDPEFLKEASTYRGPAGIARSLGVCARTVRRRQLELGIGTPQPPVFLYQPDQHPMRNPASLLARTLVPTRPLSSDQLDAIVAELMNRFQNHGRSLIHGHLHGMGYNPTRTMISDSMVRITRVPGTFGRPRIRPNKYRVAGPGSLWHHDRQHDYGAGSDHEDGVQRLTHRFGSDEVEDKDENGDIPAAQHNPNGWGRPREMFEVRVPEPAGGLQPELLRALDKHLATRVDLDSQSMLVRPVCWVSALDFLYSVQFVSIPVSNACVPANDFFHIGALQGKMSTENRPNSAESFLLLAASPPYDVRPATQTLSMATSGSHDGPPYTQAYPPDEEDPEPPPAQITRPMLLIFAAAGNSPRPFVTAPIVTTAKIHGDEDNRLPTLKTVLTAVGNLAPGSTPARELVRYVYQEYPSTHVWSGSSMLPAGYKFRPGPGAPPLGRASDHGTIASVIEGRGTGDVHAQRCIEPASFLLRGRDLAATRLEVDDASTIVVHYIFFKHFMLRDPTAPRQLLQPARLFLPSPSSPPPAPPPASRQQQSLSLERVATPTQDDGAASQDDAAVSQDDGADPQEDDAVSQEDGASPGTKPSVKAAITSAFEEDYLDVQACIPCALPPNQRRPRSENPFARRYASAYASWRIKARIDKVCEELSLSTLNPSRGRTSQIDGHVYDITCWDVIEAFGVPPGTWNALKGRFEWVDLVAELVRREGNTPEHRELLRRLSFFLDDVRTVDPQRTNPRSGSGVRRLFVAKSPLGRPVLTLAKLAQAEACLSPGAASEQLLLQPSHAAHVDILPLDEHPLWDSEHQAIIVYEGVRQDGRLRCYVSEQQVEHMFSKALLALPSLTDPFTDCDLPTLLPSLHKCAIAGSHPRDLKYAPASRMCRSQLDLREVDKINRRGKRGKNKNKKKKKKSNSTAIATPDTGIASNFNYSYLLAHSGSWLSVDVETTQMGLLTEVGIACLRQAHRLAQQDVAGDREMFHIVIEEHTALRKLRADGPLFVVCHDDRLEKHILCDALGVLPAEDYNMRDGDSGPHQQNFVSYVDTQVVYFGMTAHDVFLRYNSSLLKMAHALRIDATLEAWHNAGNDAKWTLDALELILSDDELWMMGHGREDSSCARMSVSGCAPRCTVSRKERLGSKDPPYVPASDHKGSADFAKRRVEVSERQPAMPAREVDSAEPVSQNARFGSTLDPPSPSLEEHQRIAPHRTGSTSTVHGTPATPQSGQSCLSSQDPSTPSIQPPNPAASATLRASSGWECFLCKTSSDDMYPYQLAAVHARDRHDAILRAIAGVTPQHLHAHLYEFLPGDDEIVAQFVAKFERLTIDGTTRDYSEGGHRRGASPRSDVADNGRMDRDPPSASLAAPSGTRDRSAPPQAASNPSRTRSEERELPSHAPRAESRAARPPSRAPRAESRAARPPSPLACPACQSERDAVSYSETRATLYRIAVDVGNKMMTSRQYGYRLPNLPSQLAELALPKHEERELVALLRTHELEEIYGAVAGRGYCVKHSAELVLAAAKDGQQGFKPTGVQ